MSLNVNSEAKQLLDKIRPLLPDVLSETDVKKLIRDELNNQEQQEWAEKGHTHTTEDVTDIKSVRKGLAPENHAHSVSDVSGLDTFVDKKIKAIPQKEWAEKNHDHHIRDVRGFLPLERLEGGVALKKAAEKEYAPVSHTHDDLKTSINRLERGLERIEIPDYSHDIGELRKGIEKLADLEERVAKLEKVEPPAREVLAYVHKKTYIMLPADVSDPEITARTLDGESADVGISGEFKPHSILTLTSDAPALVSFRFA